MAAGDGFRGFGDHSTRRRQEQEEEEEEKAVVSRCAMCVVPVFVHVSCGTLTVNGSGCWEGVEAQDPDPEAAQPSPQPTGGGSWGLLLRLARSN